MTIAEIIRRFARDRADHVALRWDGGQRTYGELDRRSSQAARALSASGVGAGDRVAILDTNSPEQIELVFAAAKVGAVPVPVNWRLAGAEMAAVVEDSTAKVLVAGAAFAEAARELAAAIGQPPEVVVIGAEGAGGVTDYEAWIGAQPEQDTDLEPADDDVAIQFYSSGTTGRPKGVELTHANVVAVLALWEPAAGLGTDAVNLVALPMFHIGGMALALAGHYVGATNVLMREAMPGAVLDVIVDERVTHAGLVPALLQFVLQVPGVEERDFSALSTILYGASPISETVLARAIAVFGCEFHQAYGLTETASTIVILPPSDHDPEGPNRHRLRACGLPVQGTEVRVVDPVSLEDVGTDEVGELLIKGPSVMKGYWNAPELTAEVMVDGWFRSGDLGYRDADGYLFLHDRVKDMIVSGGENVYPAEVENALAAHPAVADAAVIGVPSERWGETPKAIIVRQSGADVSEDDLIAHCREHLAAYKCPTSVDWADELPRNPAGKILKKDLRAPFWEGRERGIG